ncbi:bifunctional methylenetetrahydrofolate dehydrogenase/methenyltetrahydrofolate cyclohydrolase FolD [Pantoea sp. Acro-805]|uniref:Bifunctional protein FolD n=1 Tax=Candidatus Pantoea formicae TaxID=2608355 RepID=A0ABX0QTW5_9GAMM|nr:bifunctional methylenetetrahydrofolate dehydrogenase/methenyltetrahydrofolate cyclohydrolase FolD [Pantoea formicae]MDF7647716.1 bifunctional methylenetetrahydrofolate dehydrogenase/methenyltetrahydrofolate cyclohydrolase FolD [Erwiniaceae bacterium L1_54_3]NIE99054.1 bifunctional methylenetetrahydrofolate dehydrogenase/methenyltetrahydrofolate cyclohydrolase FolD [Pantoea formicae]
MTTTLTSQPIAINIDGKKSAAKLLENTAQEVCQLKQQGITPCLAVVLVGDDAASHVYVRNKLRTAEQVGIKSIELRFDAQLTEARLLATIDELNNDPAVHGILVQLPLPQQINESAIVRAISPVKDVDGFHPQNAGGLVQGQRVITPCTPLGCLLLLQEYGGDLSGKHAVVIGRSNIVGKPMASLLLHAHCSVTTLHSRSRDAAQLARQADILIAAVGQPQMIDASWVKPGALVIDVGINRVTRPDGSTRLVGDVDYDSVSLVAKAITPVPGGVGPMTIACLMQNTVLAAELQLQQAAG